MDRRFQVFVSSTFADLQEERQKVWQTLVSFGHIVSGMEHFPATDEEQFSYIRREIDNSDFYVLILAGRYGSLSETGISFTEREFDYAVEKGVPVFVFPIRDTKKLRVEQTDQDSEKTKKLEAFTKRACSKRLVKHWSDPTELCLNIAQSLGTAVAIGNRPGWVRGNAVASEKLLQEHVKLQSDFAKLKSQIEFARLADAGFDPGKLGSWTEIEYSDKTVDADQKTRINLPDILSQLSLLEPFTSETLEQAVRGAIATRTGKQFEDLEITEWQLDRVVTMLVKLEIAQLKETRLGFSLRRGRYFVDAHIQCKSFGHIRDSQTAEGGVEGKVSG